jgi:hypothetical protein
LRTTQKAPADEPSSAGVRTGPTPADRAMARPGGG